MAREGILYFDGVFMIESLALGETKTGITLFDNTIGPKSVAIETFRLAYRPAPDRKTFFAALTELRDSFAAADHSPVLHIETHGEENAEGLILGSGEFVAWDELRAHLQEINKITRFNLLVVMAACKGAHLIRSMRPTDRAPFWAVVGPADDVYDKPMQEALQRFYEELLRTQSGTDAMSALNKGTEATGGQYKLLDAEMYFCWIYEQHELASSDADLGERVNRIVAAWARERGPDVRETAAVRADAWERIRDHRRWYDHLRQRFLMLDLFPENADRFSLTYEMCRSRKVSV